MRRTFCGSQCAFSIVELLMVMAVLGILATMSIPVFSQYRNKAKSGASASEIRTLEKAVIAYALERGNLPATLADAGINQLDPWKRPYGYWAPGITTVAPPGYPAAPLEYFIGGSLNTDFDLYSTGADGLSDTNSGDPTSKDDIVRTNNGAFAGTRAGL